MADEWDTPILSRTRATKSKAAKRAPRPAKPNAGALWLTGVAGLAVGAVAGGAAVWLWLDQIAPPAQSPPASVPATAPASPTDQGAAFAAFARMAGAEVASNAVEGAFRSYIAVSTGATEARKDRFETRVAALGTGLSGSFDRRYLRPMMQAGLLLDECAAAVLAARLDAGPDTAVGAATGAASLATCDTRGALAGRKTGELGAFLATCQTRLEQGLAAHAAGLLDGAGFMEAASDPDRIETNPCPDPSRYIKSQTP
ncbi:MAG: hypothetical protein MUF14_05425 [Hyphomonadaceae bacterium]|nr:hypothetical protein [Hyphomonadaceae bacterium]